MSSPRLFFGEQGGAGQRGRGGGGGRNPASSQTLAFRRRQESCWKLSRSPPRPGLPESVRPQAGCWGQNPKCGSGLGGSPHTGHFYGAAKERFCKRAQPASLGCTKGGTEPPPEPGVLFLGETRRTPRCPEGFAGALPTQDKARAQHQWQGFARAPPPQPAGTSLPLPKPLGSSRSEQQGPGGAVGALSILCQLLHPHRARTQPGGPPPPAGRRRFPAGWGCLSGAALSAGTAPGRAGGVWAAAYLQRHRRGM